jgi:penicillin-binding protein 1C
VVLVLDSRDLGVRALLGSADYFNRAAHGQVNGARARRSPGSTLKPFIYGLALDQGVLHPQSILRDVPTSFGPFSPENFDGRFAGPVTATEALVRSRNIPAVQVAARLSQPSFYRFLRDAGIANMASESHYGLALVLGGGEVSMLELARLYAMLARDGELAPLRWLQDDSVATGPQLLSRESAYLVRQMLAENPRPDQPLQALRRLHPAWKTGTSWGFRDAWTAGIVGPYVLVVWLGHFDGSGNPALVGIDAAAPLWFELADRLAAREPTLTDLPRPPGLNIQPVEVCAASGDLPNVWCPQKRLTQFIPGVSPIRVSTVHRPVVVDRRSGQPVCPPFDPNATRTEVYEYWPSELAQVFIDAGMPRRRPPRLPACLDGRGERGAPPQITSPLRAVTYTLKRSTDPPQRLALSAHHGSEVRELFWFAGADFLGRVPAGQVLDWMPSGSGRYSLHVTDDHGRSNTREIEVQIQ